MKSLLHCNTFLIFLLKDPAHSFIDSFIQGTFIYLFILILSQEDVFIDLREEGRERERETETSMWKTSRVASGMPLTRDETCNLGIKPTAFRCVG